MPQSAVVKAYGPDMKSVSRTIRVSTQLKREACQMFYGLNGYCFTDACV